jgi:hypothetical protein
MQYPRQHPQQHPQHPGSDEELLTWLSGLDKEQLAKILTKRPDTLTAPWPRRLSELAVRLSANDSVASATRQLTAPGRQILCAVQMCGALGDVTGVPVAHVAQWLGASVADVTLAIEPLTELAQAWIDDTGLIRVPEVMKGHGYVRYGLGRPLDSPLSRLTVEQLKATSRLLGLPPETRKQVLVDGLLEFFRDGEQVRKLVAGAPDGVAEVLDEFVTDGPEHEVDLGHSYRYTSFDRARQVETPGRWAVNHCLLVVDYDGSSRMPLEVGLALRGPDYTLPFTPDPPVLPLAPVSPERVAAETSAAALRLLDRTTTVVEAAAVEPFPLLKSGGVGSRLIKKLAKDTGAAADEITLVLELAFETELLVAEEPPPPARKSRKPAPVRPGTVVPTEEFTRWRGENAAAQLRTLVDAWWHMPVHVLGDESSDAFDDVRRLTLRLLAELEPGTGAVSTEALIELAAWHSPATDPEILRTLVAATLAEATLTGAIASHALGELGRALVASDTASDTAELAKAAEGLVAGARSTALFGTDLTAVVTGPPSTELAALLDRVGDRETQGSASTWRFSPASVRRALDNGETTTTLIDELGSVAPGELPQPLTYLINDVARRHGEVGVLDVRSVVVGENPGLLAEIAAHRKLVKLELTSVAASVLTSTADAVTTLAALRDAGYAPVQRASDGTIMMRSEKAVAALAEPVAVSEAPPVAVENPLEHAERLLNSRGAAPRPLKRGALMNLLPGNRSGTWMRLIWQLETGFPVWIAYEEDDGVKRKVLVCKPELHGETIDVWCDEPGGYRRLELSRISPGAE